MGSDSCLQFFRWCCCCVLVLFGIIGSFIGILLLLVGIMLLWGHAVLSSIAQAAASELGNSMKDVLGPNVSLESIISGVSQMFASAAIVLIVAGLIILIISCIGCCGACCKVKGCLITYAIFVSLFIIAEAVIVILWFTNKTMIKGTVKSSLESHVSEYTGLYGSGLQTLTLNVIQIVFGCCGVVNGSDFNSNNKWNRTYSFTDNQNQTRTFNLTYPVTCCKFNTQLKLENDYCPVNGTRSESNFHIGCYNRIFQVIDEQFRLDNAFYIMIGWAGVEILLVIGAVLICCAARRDEEEMRDRDEGYKMQPMA